MNQCKERVMSQEKKAKDKRQKIFGTDGMRGKAGRFLTP